MSNHLGLDPPRASNIKKAGKIIRILMGKPEPARDTPQAKQRAAADNITERHLSVNVNKKGGGRRVGLRGGIENAGRSWR